LIKVYFLYRIFFENTMSGAEFQNRRDRDNGEGLIPRVSQETRLKLRREFFEFEGSDTDLVTTCLNRIGKVNPKVAEYIAKLANDAPDPKTKNAVAMAGISVYRLLELEFAQRGKDMPIVQREVANRLGEDMAREEEYFQRLINSLFDENDEILDVVDFYLRTVTPDDRNIRFSDLEIGGLVIASGLGVYALIKTQAEIDRLSSL